MALPLFLRPSRLTLPGTVGPVVVEPLSSARSTRTSHLVTPSLSFLDVAACPEWCLSGPSLRTGAPTRR